MRADRNAAPCSSAHRRNPSRVLCRPVPAAVIVYSTCGGAEQVIADHALAARPGESPPPIDDDLLGRMSVMNELTGTIQLPDPEPPKES